MSKLTQDPKQLIKEAISSFDIADVSNALTSILTKPEITSFITYLNSVNKNGKVSEVQLKTLLKTRSGVSQDQLNKIMTKLPNN